MKKSFMPISPSTRPNDAYVNFGRETCRALIGGATLLTDKTGSHGGDKIIARGPVVDFNLEGGKDQRP